MIIPVSLGDDSYDIILERGAIAKAGEYLKLDRKVLIVRDSGVDFEIAKLIAKQCENPVIATIQEGEQSKNLQNFETLLGTMARNGFTRTDCVLALGGGVIGDLSGFAASAFMRGVDFYNVPTTLLSQVDSSIGGKVAVNLEGYKNIVGAFHQPKRVIIDPNVLSTLKPKQINCGLAEALKMATTSDPELFSFFESGKYKEDLDTVIERSLLIKKKIVEKDVHEEGERKILNFGHTIGHAIESCKGLSWLLHGECVALGMLYMCSDDLKKRLISILEDIGLKTDILLDPDEIYKYILRDKKADGDSITITYVNEVGKPELRKIPIEETKNYIVR